MFDSTGGLIGSYEYDAWGNVQCFDGEGNALTDETDIVVVNPIRYRGYYYDAETGLYYISSRYYDPSVKRMLNSDDESLSAASLEALTDKNYFAYCDNNPVGREAITCRKPPFGLTNPRRLYENSMRRGFARTRFSIRMISHPAMSP